MKAITIEINGKRENEIAAAVVRNAEKMMELYNGSMVIKWGEKETVQAQKELDIPSFVGQRNERMGVLRR